MYDETRTETVRVTQLGTPEDHYFKERMRREGWTIQDDETVTEFIKRVGHPFHISYEERNDN